jgi:hypothetical protein
MIPKHQFVPEPQMLLAMHYDQPQILHCCLFRGHIHRNHAPHLGADLRITELTANHILSY